MDFGLGGYPRLCCCQPTGKEALSLIWRKQREIIDIREAMHGKVGGGDDVENIILAGVESHPCREY